MLFTIAVFASWSGGAWEQGYLAVISIVYLRVKGGELLKFPSWTGVWECQGCWCPTEAFGREGDTDWSPVLHQSQYNTAVYHQGCEEKKGGGRRGKGRNGRMVGRRGRRKECKGRRRMEERGGERGRREGGEERREERRIPWSALAWSLATRVLSTSTASTSPECFATMNVSRTPFSSSTYATTGARLTACDRLFFLSLPLVSTYVGV